MITINGQWLGFNGTQINQLSFGSNGINYNCSSYAWISSSLLTCTLPATLAAGTYYQFIVTVNGVASLPSPFFFIRPIQGPLGNTITVYGGGSNSSTTGNVDSTGTGN